ncbi:uncharacterized protein LOC133896113 [Phragmites australis]|uniref:uncharacterized protein LOC133896113 n=1 Tax=Phragmites australis TaxID=29695 RepID=UPI002D76E985|nr:uncharacterized protein LOC133896113 [Phragmites australis]
MALNFLRPGAPGEQPVGVLFDAASVGDLRRVLNGLASQSYLQRCLCDGPCVAEDVEQRSYQLANFVVVTGILGVTLLVVHMEFSATLCSSAVLHPVLGWMVWITKGLDR